MKLSKRATIGSSSELERFLNNLEQLKSLAFRLSAKGNLLPEIRALVGRLLNETYSFVQKKS